MRLYPLADPQASGPPQYVRAPPRDSQRDAGDEDGGVGPAVSV